MQSESILEVLADKTAAASPIVPPAVVAGEGMLLALVSVGLQDAKMMFRGDAHAKIFRDVRAEWLSERHATTYRKIDVEKAFHAPSRCLLLKLARTCDMVNELDLVLRHDAPPIKSVEVQIGGQRIDRIDFDVTRSPRSTAAGRRSGTPTGRRATSL